MPQEYLPLWHSYEAALNWLVTNHLPGGGIAVSNVMRKPYPEVTGYIVPSLLDAGENKLVLELARWLVSIQRSDGGFDGHDGEPYLFDTGQVMRGLAATIKLLPESIMALRKAADWMLANADENGVIRPKPTSVWSQRFGDHISEDIHLYTLPPLIETGRLLNEPKYIQCAEKSLAYYVSKPELLRFQFLTHFYGYVLEALVDLGREDLARIGLQPIIEAQLPDGLIPAVPGAEWTCSPGTAQMGIVGYKLGLAEFANAALDRLQMLQMPGGGFLGSYGPGAAYAEGEELSWACKYFLDACHLRIQKTFDEQKERFAVEVEESDARLAAVLSVIGDAAPKRILDVGCGRGPFLRKIQAVFPAAVLTGVDVSAAVLSQVPPGVQTKQASILNLPFPDASFDVVLCIEALEHAIRIERAISELCRVLRQGGRVLIIDKDIKYLGMLNIEPWEKWFDPDHVAALLEHYCDDVTYQYLPAPWDEQKRALFVAWQATRGGPEVIQESSQSLNISAMLKPSLETLDLYRRSQKHTQARLLAQQGFARYKGHDLPGARRAFWGAIRRDRSWLKNRGVLSIILESVIGSRAMGLVRGGNKLMKFNIS